MARRLTAEECMARFWLYHEATEHLLTCGFDANPDMLEEAKQVKPVTKHLMAIADEWFRKARERKTTD